MNTSTMMNGAMPRQIVGAAWVEHPGAWWVPKGLESTQSPGARPPAYRPLSFGAEREWANDEEGWQGGRHKRQKKRTNRNHNRTNQDTYDFDDTY